MRQLIPLGSLTGDPIGTQRYMVVNGNTTAAETIVIYLNTEDEIKWVMRKMFG